MAGSPDRLLEDRDMKPTETYATSPDRAIHSTTHTGTMPPTEDSSVESFDLLLQQFRERSEAKTLVMEEALHRSESTQRRFWGINE